MIAFPHHRRPLRWGAALAVLVSVLGCSAEVDQAEVPTFAVARRDFAIRIEAPGQLKPKDAVSVSAGRARGGQVIAWLAPEGSLVKAGAVVVEFDPTRAKQLLEQADADVRRIEQELKKLAVQVTIKNDDLASEELTARILRDKAAFKASLGGGVVPSNQIEQAKMDLRLADIDIDRIRRAKVSKAPQDNAARALLEIALEKANNQKQLAFKDLGAASVKAEADGVISYQMIWKAGGRDKVAAGDSVWSGQSVANLLDLSTMDFVAGVREEHAVHVKEGQSATVLLAAFPDRPLRATVRSIAAVAEQSDRRVPVKRVEVKLTLDSPIDGLYAGLTGAATVETVSEQAVLTVPPDAILKEGDDRYVYVPNGGTPEKRPVTIGEEGVRAVVVTAGLTEGELVFARDPTKTAEELKADRVARQEEARKKRKKPGESGRSLMLF